MVQRFGRACHIIQSTRQVGMIYEYRELTPHDKQNVNKNQSNQERKHSQHCSTAAAGDDRRGNMRSTAGEQPQRCGRSTSPTAAVSTRCPSARRATSTRPKPRSAARARSSTCRPISSTRRAGAARARRRSPGSCAWRIPTAGRTRSTRARSTVPRGPRSCSARRRRRWHCSPPRRDPRT